MRIPLDRQSSIPIYLQIRDHIRRLIQSGSLQPNDRLPSVRVLAKDVQVNKMTVTEAYSALEADGLIHARQGAGYFVNTVKINAPKSESTYIPVQEVIIAERQTVPFLQLHTAMVQAQQQEGVINFSSPFPRLTDLNDLRQIAKRAIDQTAHELLNYGLPQGQPFLRQQIMRLLAQQGLEVSLESIIITNGSQQGLSLVIHQHVQPGDWVIVESPTYPGAIEVLETLGAKIIGVPMTSQGVNLELLEQYLSSYRPKLIYTISTLHNPTGLSLPQTHRQQLLALAEQYECLILEDNAYEGLNFEPVPAPIKALDQTDSVIYIGTFSKTLSPGLRLGFIVATGQRYQPILQRKLLYDLQVSNISQAIISEYLASGHYRRHLSRFRSSHLQKRNLMLQALEQHFPQEATWIAPQGGYFLLIHLPIELPTQEVTQKAAEQGVLINFGLSFAPSQQCGSTVRLNFSQSLEEIEQGIAILGGVLKTFMLSSSAG
jgi:DNA-binding transcriptional MocR family regulator